MVAHLWRVSHLALAAVSAIFLLMATLTGLILAFEPVQDATTTHYVKDSESLPLIRVIDTLKSQFDEVLALEVDAYGAISADVFNLSNDISGSFYIDPFSGEILAPVGQRSPLFTWTTNFHRSLFLKTPGRIFVGLASLLLALIAVTGFLLVLRRLGWRRFFFTLRREDFYQYYHTFLGRLSLIPVLIVALTGLVLFLARFEVIPEPDLLHVASAESAIGSIQTILVGDVRHVEFPFSAEESDPYVLALRDRELTVHQYTGQVLTSATYPFSRLASALSYNLHTGSGSVLWSIVLAVACLNILFFMYSGATITVRRLRASLTNGISTEEAEIVVLVGSENGKTKGFAWRFIKALRKKGQRVYAADMNGYRNFPKMRQLVIMTCTYGDGDPPSNASKFMSLSAVTRQPPTEFAVLGFGSTSFPKFCQFAKDVDVMLRRRPGFTALHDAFLVDKNSTSRFEEWASLWSTLARVRLRLPAGKRESKVKFDRFKVLSRQLVDDGFDKTFTMVLAAPGWQYFKSGDLLAIAPPGDEPRQYSVGKTVEGDILLSVKCHEQGVCSNYLMTLQAGDSLRAELQKNAHFHFPDHADEVLLVGNGTGIAPFLGMINEVTNGTAIRLFWGGRTKQSFKLYDQTVQQAYAAGRLTEYRLAFSRENGEPPYVQNLLVEEANTVARQLDQGAAVMICGSLAMQQGVIETLHNLVKESNGQSIEYYEARGQIMTDCY